MVFAAFIPARILKPILRITVSAARFYPAVSFLARAFVCARITLAKRNPYFLLKG